jgi:restriction system protein
MELPKYHETFLQILEILSKTESLKSRELGIKVRDKYYSNLPLDLLNEKTSSGANVLLDRIAWGKSYLKLGKFVQSPNEEWFK